MLITNQPIYLLVGVVVVCDIEGSPVTSNISIGSLHLNTGMSRSNVVTSGGGSTIQPNSLSQLIQFRTQRSSNRQRRCAYLNLNGRDSNPPAILQRLLGPSVAQNIGLGQVIANANGSASFRDATRVVVMDNGFGIFSNSGEPSIDLVDQAGYLFGRSLAATLNSTPSPLHWWLEEAKILGLESQADVCLTVCNDLIPELEVQRAQEMKKARGKRRKKPTSDGGTATVNTTATGNKEKAIEVDARVAVEQTATIVTRSNATGLSNGAHQSDTTAAHVDSNATSDNQTNDFAATSHEHNDNGENFDSEEETDVSGDDDDNSSKPENDAEPNDDNIAEECIQLPNLINSYVESNEEMTESDGNPLEEESNQNEVNGGGSASDSGNSIASSVSAEPFYQQQQNTMDRLFGASVNFAQGSRESDEGRPIYFIVSFFP